MPNLVFAKLEKLLTALNLQYRRLQEDKRMGFDIITRMIAVQNSWWDFRFDGKNFPERNLVLVRGTFISNAIYIFSRNGKHFYKTFIEVNRFSQQKDFIKVIVSSDILSDNLSLVGKVAEIEGVYQSRNEYGSDGKSHLKLFLLVKKIRFIERQKHEQDENLIFLSGKITKRSYMRTTPFGKRITDLVLAVKRDDPSTKLDYIPCIAWGELAKYMDGVEKGTQIKIKGRIQSRHYIKRYDDPKKPGVVKTAYEVSIMEAKFS